MKKLILLIAFIFSLSGYAQAEFENIQITNNTTDNAATKVVVQSASNVLNTIAKNDLIDVIIVNTTAELTAGIGDTSKLYATRDNTIIYRFNGTIYVPLGSDISGKENTANKQNSLAVDGTGVKFPTVDAVNTGLATKISGSGTTNFIPRFTASGTVGDSSLFETPSGVIGIGTTTPSAYFGKTVEIAGANGGSLVLKGSSVEAVLFTNNGGGSASFGTNTNHPIDITVNGLPKSRFHTDDSFTVGTTTNNGQGKLQVNGNITANPATLSNQVVVKSQLDEKIVATENFIPKVNSSGNLVNSQIFENSTGIGIGTAAPDALFVISKNGSPYFILDPDTSILLGNSDGATSANIILNQSSGAESVYQARELALGDVDGVNNGTFFNISESNRRFDFINGNAIFEGTSDNGIDKVQVNGTISASPATLSNQVVVKSQLDLKADLASPALTGTPQAPTAPAGTNTTQIATTAFVTGALGSFVPSGTVNLTGAQTVAGIKTFSSSPIVPAAVNANEAVNKGQLDAAASSGSYTPTLSNNANIASTFLKNATYTKVGNIVTVNIGFELTLTAANTISSLRVTLPIARTTANAHNVGSGSAAIIGGGGLDNISIFCQGGTTTTSVVCNFYGRNAALNHVGSVTFQYDITQ